MARKPSIRNKSAAVGAHQPARDVAALLDLGIKHHNSGDLKRAAKIYQKVLKQAPEHADALHLLGLTAHQAGDQRRAIRLIQKAIAINPKTASYHNSLGEAYRTEGFIDKAKEQYEVALKIENNPMFINNLGLVLQHKGEYERAIECFEEAIKKDQSSAAAFNNAGNSFRSLGNYDRAIHAFMQAIRLSPETAMVYNNLGLTYQDKGQIPKAVLFFKKAIEKDNRYSEAINNLATLYWTIGENKLALDHFEKALRYAPKDPSILANMAVMLEKYNRLDEATSAAKRAIKQDKLHSPANIALASLEFRENKLDTAKERLTNSLSDKLAPSFQTLGYSKLGAIYDLQGEYNKAYAAFTKMNELTKKLSDYQGISIKNGHKKISQHANYYTANALKSWRHQPAEDNQSAPIFFVGFPRSGTTLLEQILDSHHRIIAIEEKNMLGSVEAEFKNGAEDYSIRLANLEQNELMTLRSQYWERAQHILEEEINGRLLLDKFPLNIIDLGFAYRLFPEAKVIVALRDPRDVCLSCFIQDFSPNSAMANFYDLRESAEYYSKVMGLWLQYKEAVPLDFTYVRYEDLVNDQEGETKRLLDFLNLDWDESVLSYWNKAREKQIETPSYIQVSKPIYKTAKERWRNYPEQIKEIAPILEPFIKHFSYSLD
ncbi:MAG: tetratricopeptide repeat protein [Gammaproteobacteria bacterium]|nr:tetratricopeptide repeat protein [Gammaproteobacteria bacterium]